LAIVRVHAQAGRGQDHRHSDRAAGGVVHAAADDHAVNVQLHRGAGLGGLDDVFDHPAGQVGVVIGGIYRGGTRTIGKTSDETTERSVLTRFLTDGGDINLGAGNFKAPLTNTADGGGCGKDDAGEIGAKTRGLCGCSNDPTASGGTNRHDASGGVVGLDEVITRSDRVGGAGASRIGQGHRIVDLEAQVGADSDVAARGGEVGGDERGNRRTSGGVVQGAGGARKNGGH